MYLKKAKAATTPRHTLLIFCRYCFALIALFGIEFSYASTGNIYTIQWTELIPEADLEAILNPPESITSIVDGSPEDRLSGSLADSIEQAIGASKAPLSPEEKKYYKALESTNIKAEYNNKHIRIPGFIVPVEYNDQQVITEFFLVPYFGACIHVPPPPPNQIIYVKYPKGLTLEALYDPFWVEGLLQTEITENELAISAYALSAKAIKPYKAYNEQ